MTYAHEDELSALDTAKLEHALSIEEGRRTMLGFTRHTFPIFQENWHHKIICDALDQVERGVIKKLIIMTPPRHGKSELVSRRFPAYCLGRDPNRKIMGCSHNQGLAQDMSKDVQNIIRSEQYTELFNTRMGGRESVMRWDAATEASLEGRATAPRGGYKAASTGTGIAGYGYNIGIIDDYVGKWQDIEGAKFLDTLWKWYINDFLTRKNAPWGIVVMATPWHPDDLIGRILAGPDAADWTVIRLPYLAEETSPSYDPRAPGEPLWPERLFLPISEASPPRKEMIKESVAEYRLHKQADPVGAAALLDTRPRASHGLLLNPEDLREYTTNPRVIKAGADALYVSVDCTFKGTATADRVAILVGARMNDQMYILEGDSKRLTYSQTKAELRMYAARYPSATFIIEDKANGPAIIDELQSDLPAIVAYNPTSSKNARAQVAASRTKQGIVHWPAVKWCVNVAELKDEVVRYGEARYDDVMDAYSQLLLASTPKKSALNRLKAMSLAFRRL